VARPHHGRRSRPLSEADEATEQAATRALVCVWCDTVIAAYCTTQLYNAARTIATVVPLLASANLTLQALPLCPSLEVPVPPPQAGLDGRRVATGKQGWGVKPF